MTRIYSLADLPTRQLESARTGEQYSLSQSLSDAAGLDCLLIHREVIAPGQRASAPHRHSKKEELFWVLAGVATVVIGPACFEVKAGEFIAIKPAQDFHYLANQGQEPLIILSIGNRDGDDTTEFDVESTETQS